MNHSYRPTSYWGVQDLATHYGARVKGELRRRVVMRQVDEGDVDPGIAVSALDNGERAAAGAFHPWFMGGEYLPDLLYNEVEIARMTFKSTTMDVMSIRARKTKHRILYRIVDEYEDLGYVLKPKTSRHPLTMAQVIDLIDSNHLVDGPRNFNFEEGCCEAAEIYDFATVSSAFYPELVKWFDDANDRWLQAEQARLSKEAS